MIIRFKKANRPETMEFIVAPEDIDYWIDYGKRHLCIEIRGTTYVARRGKQAFLEEGLDKIHEAVTKNRDLVDLCEGD